MIRVLSSTNCLDKLFGQYRPYGIKVLCEDGPVNLLNFMIGQIPERILHKMRNHLIVDEKSQLRNIKVLKCELNIL